MDRAYSEGRDQVNPATSIAFLKISAASQAIMAAVMLFQENANINTTIAGVTAFGTFANLVVLVGLIYKIGRYTGTTDQTIVGMEKSIAALTETEKGVVATQAVHSLALQKLQSDSSNMQSDVKTVRDRQHEFANILTQFTMQQINLKPMRDQG